MAKSNGGIIGALNPTSFGKCTVTSQTSSGTLTTQPGTRIVATAIVAGGGGGGGTANFVSKGGGAGGLRTNSSLSVCGATAYPIVVGSGGTAAVTFSPLQVIQEMILQVLV
jgi:hypothetical protein